MDSEPPYLYNRCHLIGFQLAGENDNEKNLITGTRYFNVEGMLPFENAVRNYVDETDNHVLYRVTPIYDAYFILVFHDFGWRFAACVLSRREFSEKLRDCHFAAWRVLCPMLCSWLFSFVPAAWLVLICVVAIAPPSADVVGFYDSVFCHFLFCRDVIRLEQRPYVDVFFAA